MAKFMSTRNELNHDETESAESDNLKKANSEVLRRIDGRYVAKEIGKVLNLQRGILYTTKKLMFRPGSTIRSFLFEDRSRHVKPVFFIIICSLIYTVLRHLLNFEDDYVSVNKFNESSSTAIFIWIKSNYGYANLILAIFITAWARILFRSCRYNYYEILIALSFIMGGGMLILLVFGIIEPLINLKVVHYGGMAYAIYCNWAIAQFFDGKKIQNFLKAFLSFFLGLLSFFMGIFAFGSIIDWIQNIVRF